MSERNGFIRQADIEHIRQEAPIEDVVGRFVTFANGGGYDSRKACCPFHDEKTPSFHVRPAARRWHCFGCSEGGDVISFMQKLEGLDFREAVESVAQIIGYTLQYEEAPSGFREKQDGKRNERKRLLEINKLSAQYFTHYLSQSEGIIGRRFLAERGFTQADAELFGLGYSPNEFRGLTEALKRKGYSEEEIVTSGMSVRNDKGNVYDRFRGRMMWPIRDTANNVIGFGARKLHEDDQGPKYLNTPETPLYKKSQVLYGIDLARKNISNQKQIVVVEGYTDVMAAHLAGVTTAVATCGTAFGSDHARIAQRLIGGQADAGAKGDIIFTFDGDSAGQKAAMRAFGEQKLLAADTYVAVAPGNMDPCDLRFKFGDQAVIELIKQRRPLIQFVLETHLSKFNLATVEGRMRALREVAPVLKSIDDEAIRDAYAEEIAHRLNLALSRVITEIRNAPEASVERYSQRVESAASSQMINLPQVNAEANAEMDFLVAVLKLGSATASPLTLALDPDVFYQEAYKTIYEAIRETRELGVNGTAWYQEISNRLPDYMHNFFNQMLFLDLQKLDKTSVEEHLARVGFELSMRGFSKKLAELGEVLQGMDENSEGYYAVVQEILDMQDQRRIHRQSLEAL